ncbi:Disease resistance protein [Corchorus capsularis]|uniref:Disease resistance protein n=1 Tax=Corchorus capsularis TaxID=210143 RepID=A0A1R3G397_COCAP|nr:Disease resistance protein [Corchorus capsularis]
MGGFCEAWGSNVLASVFVDYMVKPTVRHVGYMFRFNKILKDLREKSEQLKVKQASVEATVKDAENQNQRINAVVEDWRTKARTLQQDVESFDVKLTKENKRCFYWCPDFYWRYRLSKQAAEKSLAISQLVDKSRFEVVGHPADLPGISLLPSKEFLPSKSADSAERQIMEALKDDAVNIIGVWGMGGVGKTTLVKKVGRKAKEELKLFGEVVLVTVSQNPNIGKIQTEIAESLKLRLSNTTEDGKAEQVWARLQNEKSILIILDDVWKELDLKAVGLGIPVGEHRFKGCKILLTTRSERVCSFMQSGRVVRLDLLNENEACQLFKSSAALDDNTSSDIAQVAAEVVKECKGLPIALSTLGKALKGASLHKWREASQSLKNHTVLDNIECVAEDDRNAYICLKLSYDFLKLEHTKKCFLLCSFYPEDHSIPIEELVRHAWSLELFKGKKSIQEARDAIYTVMDDLKACSLLLDDGKTHVKMHDMVRDVALWIASQKENHFVIKSELRAREWPMDENFEHCTAISFLDCNIKVIPEGLEYSELGLLSFTDGVLDEEKTIMFSGSSFQGMKSLKALNMMLRRIPPKVIGRLSRLEELYLRWCWFKFDEWLVEGSTNAQVRNASLFELNELPCLTTLVLNVVDSERIPKDFVFPELQNYSIGIGGDADEDYPSRRYLKISKIATLHAFKNLLEVVDVLELFSIVNYQSLVDVRNYQHVPVTFSNLSVLKINGMNCFKGLCNGPPPDGFLKKLETLKIWGCDSLKNLFPASVPDGFLKKLETLDIFKCGSLKTLFPASVTKNFVQLKSVKITACNMLEHIFEEMEGANEYQVLPKLETLEIDECGSLRTLFPGSVTKKFVQLKSVKIAACNMLEHIFEEMEGANDQVLSKLETLEIMACGSLKTLFPASVTKKIVQLKSVQIFDCNMLEHIFKGMEGADDEVRQKLESLKIIRCSSLKYLFPPSVAEKLVQLKILRIHGCDMLEQIVEEMEVANGEILSVNTCFQPLYLLPNLKTLRISNCAKLECLVDMTRKQHLPAIELMSNLEELQLTSMTSLKWLFNGECPNRLLQKLQSLVIRRCSSMTSLFPLSFAQNLVQLKKVDIVDCNMLERLVTEDDNFQMYLSNNHDGHHPTCLQELEALEISNCSKLEYVLPSSLVGNGLPQLKNLTLRNLHELKQVIPLGQGRNGGNDVCLKLLPMSLKTLQLSGCPKLRPFTVSSTHQMMWICIEGSESNQLFNIPVVAQGRVNSSNKEYAVIGNHVEEMFHLHESGNILSILTMFEVKNLPELRVIWRCPKQLMTLQNLEDIEVFGCNRLRYVFSPLLARNLPKLRHLKIEKCEDLEQIVDASSSSPQDPEQQSLNIISFPNLMQIEIESCNNLKYVFPISIVADLQRLGNIWISKARKLEQVFGCEDKADAKDHDQVEETVLLLPRLHKLYLQVLPSLISFSSVDYHFLFPSLYKLKVADCRQMTTTFSIDSESCAHAKPQASQQTEDPSTAQETMWPRGSNIDWSRRGYTLYV